MTTSNTTRALGAHVLLNALGGLIGFIPERSLILIVFDPDGAVNTTMRHDLMLTADGQAQPEFGCVVENLATICGDYAAAAVVAVIVEDRYPPNSPVIAELIAAVDGYFGDIGGLAAAFATREYATDGVWHTVLSGTSTRLLAPPPRTGVFADPNLSPTALDRALRRGRPVLRKRSEMEAMLSELPHCADTGDDGSGCRNHGDRETVSGPTESLRERRRRLLRFALEQIAEVTADREHRRSTPGMACDVVRTWEEALTDLALRDALLSFAATDFRADAEQVWRELTRRLAGSAKASAATMLAHLHYFAGEGAFASIALDVALGADPDWSFAILIDRALRAGVRPTLFAEVMGESYRVAADLGIGLPPVTRPATG